MRTLVFDVKKQFIRKDLDCDFSCLIVGTVGYLRAQFKFSDDWDGCAKVASFWLDNMEYPVLLDKEDSCLIPAEVLSSTMFKVSVTGAKGPKYRIKSGKTKVVQEVP